MNWDAVSFDWNQVRAFLATVEEGSFSAAARALRTTQPTVGRQMSELEARLGVTLMERSVRGPSLTEAGENLLRHVRAMGDAASMISMGAAGHATEISGTVKITVTDMLAVDLLPRLLRPLRQMAPAIRLDVLPSNDIKDLLKREADIAIRHQRPEQPELIARHVSDLKAYFYASKTYLERAGRPQKPRDLAGHDFVGVPDPKDLISQLRNIDVPLTEENFVLGSDSGVVMNGFLKAGFGVSLLPAALCDGTPGLERLLPDMPPQEFPVWLVTHRELQTSRRIRIVFDLLAQGLAHEAKRDA